MKVAEIDSEALPFLSFVSKLRFGSKNRGGDFAPPPKFTHPPNEQIPQTIEIQALACGATRLRATGATDASATLPVRKMR
jgi:hypothetical protein